MKFFAVLVAAAVAVTSAQQPCDTQKLVGIATGANGAACTAATGYTPASLSIPSGDDLKKVCSTESCKSLLAEMNAAIPTECLFSGVPVKSTLLDKFPGACAGALGTPAASSAAPGATTPAPSATSMAPGASTPAPSATTMAPGATTMAPGATSAAPGAVVVVVPVPSATTPMPSMEGSSSGSMDEGSKSSAGDSSMTQAPSPGGSVPSPTPASAAAPLTVAASVVVASAVAAML